MDSRNEGICSKFTNTTKLCGAVDMLGKCRSVALSSHESGACANLTEFNKAKWKVLHLGQGNQQAG